MLDIVVTSSGIVFSNFCITWGHQKGSNNFWHWESACCNWAISWLFFLMPETFFGWGEWIKDLFSRVELKFFGVIQTCASWILYLTLVRYGILWKSVCLCVCIWQFCTIIPTMSAYILKEKQFDQNKLLFWLKSYGWLDN